jgi:hypothetical protein
MRRRATAAEVTPCCRDWAMLLFLTTIPIKKDMQQNQRDKGDEMVEGGLKEEEGRSVRRARQN